jgi:hypothetical protein
VGQRVRTIDGVKDVVNDLEVKPAHGNAAEGTKAPGRPDRK